MIITDNADNISKEIYKRLGRTATFIKGDGLLPGKKEVLSVKLSEEVVDPDDVEMLEDLIVAAVNEALTQVDQAAAGSMAKLTGGMNMPGMF